MTHDIVMQRCVLVAFRWLAALFLSLPAHAEPVHQAMAHHGGSIVIAQRQGPCKAGERMALDLRPAGFVPVAVGGCARIVDDTHVAITWRGWPGARLYPLRAFRAAQRDLSWVGH